MLGEVSGKGKDFKAGKGDENNFVETPDGRAKGSRNIAGTIANSNGGTPAMRNTATGPSNTKFAKIGADAIEGHVAAKPLGTGKASRKVAPGREA